jgi:AcrR family transcriptional regulator
MTAVSGLGSEVRQKVGIMKYTPPKKRILTRSDLDNKQTGLYSQSVKRTEAISEARQRILETADRLFYHEGIRAVGVDRIIAEAGVAKMSLYKHFPSKDALILSVLKHREEAFQISLQEAMDRHSKKTKDPLRAFFAALKEWFETPSFRGCAFINAAVELADPTHPASEFVRGQKERFAKLLRGLIEQAVGKKAAAVAPAVGLLIEGAIVTAVIQGSPRAVAVARDASLKLVGSEKGA